MRARKPGRLPVALTLEEVRSILGELAGPPRLVVALLYGPGAGVGMAVRVSCFPPQAGAPIQERSGTTTSARGLRDSESCAHLRPAGWFVKTGRMSYIPSLLRHASSRGRLRHPHDSGADGTRRCEDDDDLHPCAEPGRRERSTKPDRETMTSRGGRQKIDRRLSRHDRTTPRRPITPPSGRWNDRASVSGRHLQFSFRRSRVVVATS